MSFPHTLLLAPLHYKAINVFHCPYSLPAKEKTHRTAANSSVSCPIIVHCMNINIAIMGRNCNVFSIWWEIKQILMLTFFCFNLDKC